MKFTPFDKLLSTKMTRKEFLVHLGTMLFVLTGISTLLQTIADPQLAHKNTKRTTSFGSGSYGV